MFKSWLLTDTETGIEEEAREETTQQKQDEISRLHLLEKRVRKI